MMYLRYALYAPLSLLFNVFVILTSPIWAGMVAVTRAAHLPGILSYLYTDDDDIYGSGMTKDPIPPTVWGRFKRAMWWLCRNPGFGFAKNLLGRPNSATDQFAFHIMMIDQTRPAVWDSGEYCVEHFIAITGDGRRWFNYRTDIPLPMSKYCKIWLGWQDDGRLKIMFNPFLTSRGNQ